MYSKLFQARKIFQKCIKQFYMIWKIPISVHCAPATLSYRISVAQCRHTRTHTVAACNTKPFTGILMFSLSPSLSRLYNLPATVACGKQPARTCSTRSSIGAIFRQRSPAFATPKCMRHFCRFRFAASLLLRLFFASSLLRAVVVFRALN